MRDAVLAVAGKLDLTMGGPASRTSSSSTPSTRRTTSTSSHDPDDPEVAPPRRLPVPRPLASRSRSWPRSTAPIRRCRWTSGTRRSRRCRPWPCSTTASCSTMARALRRAGRGERGDPRRAGRRRVPAGARPRADARRARRPGRLRPGARPGERLPGDAEPERIRVRGLRPMPNAVRTGSHCIASNSARFPLAVRRRPGRHRAGGAAGRRRPARRRRQRRGPRRRRRRPASRRQGQAGRAALHGRGGQPHRPLRLQARADQAARPAVRLRRARRGVPERPRPVAASRSGTSSRTASAARCSATSSRRSATCVDDIAFVHNVVGKTGVHSPATLLQTTGFNRPAFPAWAAGSATASAA